MKLKKISLTSWWLDATTTNKSILADRSWFKGKFTSGDFFSLTDIGDIVDFQFSFCSKYGVKHQLTAEPNSKPWLRVHLDAEPSLGPKYDY